MNHRDGEYQFRSRDLYGLIVWTVLLLVVVFVATKALWFDDLHIAEKTQFWVDLATATGTIGLVVVGSVAAVYAYRTAIAAIQSARASIETLRLEFQPVLMASIEGRVTDRTRLVAISRVNGKVCFSIPLGSSNKEPTVFVTLSNVGRAPAVNLRFDFSAKERLSDEEPVIGPVFVQKLLSGESYTIGFVNQDFGVFDIDVVSAEAESYQNIGSPQKTLLARSQAFPFPLV